MPLFYPLCIAVVAQLHFPWSRPLDMDPSHLLCIASEHCWLPKALSVLLMNEHNTDCPTLQPVFKISLPLWCVCAAFINKSRPGTMWMNLHFFPAIANYSDFNYCHNLGTGVIPSQLYYCFIVQNIYSTSGSVSWNTILYFGYLTYSDQLIGGELWFSLHSSSREDCLVKNLSFVYCCGAVPTARIQPEALLIACFLRKTSGLQGGIDRLVINFFKLKSPFILCT